jgi:hypothetical protein
MKDLFRSRAGVPLRSLFAPRRYATLSTSARAHARERAAAIHMISLAFLTTWGQSGASGCRTINHWQLGAGFLAFSRSCK